MLDTLIRLFTYDEWGNREALRSVRAMTTPTHKAGQLLAHIAAAQWLWLERLRELPQSVPVWPEWTLDETEAQLARVQQGWRTFVAEKNEADLARTFAYRNSKGERYVSTIGDACLHVVMHSTYHRGQIAMLVREHGGEPAYTDFIQAARTGKI